MSIPTIERRPVTEAVVTAVGRGGHPVGLCEAPADGGYQSEYGKSAFVPYSVVTPMQSQPGTGPFTDPQADTQFAYAVSSYAPDATAAEWMADKARAAIVTLVGQQFPSANKYISYVWVTGYGQLQRDDQVNPPFFAQTDTYAISLMG